MKAVSPLDSVLLHDQLADTYHAVYLTEFIEHTSRFGLRYLSDTERHDTSYLQPEVQQAVEGLGSDPMVQAQLLDIGRFRMFRQAVLARSDAQLAAPDPAGVVERSHIASEKLLPHLSASKGPEPPADPILQEQQVAAALAALACRWPNTVPFAELARQMNTVVGGESGRSLARLLLKLHWKGYLELWLHEPTYIGNGSNPQKARTTKLARAQAASSAWMTNLRHMVFNPASEPPRHIVAALDGTPPSAEALKYIAMLASSSMLLAD
jgi:hypothetical protein